MSKYIVQSGSGYFIRFDNGTPFMDSDPVCATRMNKKMAMRTIAKLSCAGWCGELIKIIHARIREVF